MDNKEILKIAKKVKKDLKGKTDFISVEKYLEELNCAVVLYNTPIGNEELKRHNLFEDAQDVQAFTYTGPGKIVFIDNDVSAEDKRLLLCHELGHIALGHFKEKRLIRNKMIYELEANAFTSYLINDNKKDYKATVLFCAIASASTVIATTLFKKVVQCND